MSGAVLNLILGHPGVSGFAPRNAEVQQWYRKQKVPQLQRDDVAKATGASRPPTEETQKVMAVLEVDVINLNALPQPGGMRRVLSIIDGFSLYSAQRPMRNETAETVSRSMADFLELSRTFAPGFDLCTTYRDRSI